MLPVEQPQVEVEVDMATAHAMGETRRCPPRRRHLIVRVQVGSLFEEQKVFDVVVWGTPETRHSLSSIRELLVDTPSGTQVRLGDVARVNIVPGPNVSNTDPSTRTSTWPPLYGGGISAPCQRH